MNTLCKIFQWLRFGTIHGRNIEQIDNIICEIEYRGRFNKIVGYWAYGNFDPDLPYRGECK